MWDKGARLGGETLGNSVSGNRKMKGACVCPQEPLSLISMQWAEEIGIK